jgi:hypothetical protein
LAYGPAIRRVYSPPNRAFPKVRFWDGKSGHRCRSSDARPWSREVDLLGQRQGVVHLDAEVSDSAFELAMAE